MRKKTTSEFISEAKLKRTDIDFDYSKVQYKGAKTKVTIIDPEFGEFDVAPDNFLNGNGHPVRGKESARSKRSFNGIEFIERAKQTRTDIDFDYSKVKYQGSKTKVTIIDPEFGEFDITPSHFLRGQGHPVRAGTKKSNTTEFIEKAKKIRNELNFDYRKVQYKNAHTKVTIIDPEFGEFDIAPSSFLSGVGHPVRGGSKKSSTAEFIERAKQTRTDIDFDYSNVQYKNAHTKVTIIDPDFGAFDITPAMFLRGRGHPVRAGTKKSNTTEFIEKAKKIRNELNFDYRKVQYTNSCTKVTIIDPEFGEFDITPGHFFSGQGHPNRAKKEHNCLYFIIVRDEFGQFVKFKFGLATAHTLQGRIDTYCNAVLAYNKKYSTKFSTHVACTIELGDKKSARKIESTIHTALRKEFICGFTQSSNKFTGSNTETYGSEAFTVFERLIVSELNKVDVSYNTNHSTDEVDALLYGII